MSEYWQIQSEDKRLHLKIKFNKFTEAFSFITEIALISEKIDHHPEWKNCYGNISIELYTHEKNCITNLDIDLAHQINQVLNLKDKSTFVIIDKAIN